MDRKERKPSNQEVSGLVDLIWKVLIVKSRKNIEFQSQNRESFKSRFQVPLKEFEFDKLILSYLHS